MHPLAGGVFPFPPMVSELVKRLAPPNMFEGPYVIIDELINMIKEVELREGKLKKNQNYSRKNC